MSASGGAGGAGGTLVPDFQVKVAGQPLAPEVRADVIGLVVALGLGAFPRAELELTNTGSRWSSGGPFQLGARLDVELGYLGAREAVFEGEVVEVSPCYREGGGEVLQVGAHHRMHRLARGRHSATYQDMKDSDIVKKLAGEAGLTARCEDTGVVHPHVFQANRTHLEFILERALLHDFEVLAEGTTLHFRRPALGTAPCATLTRGATLIAFHPECSLLGQPTEVQVRGWDPRTKEPILGKAKVGDEAPRLGERSGPEVAKKVLKDTRVQLSGLPVRTQAEADAYARAEMSRRARRYAMARGEASGRPSLAPGRVVELDGVGTRFGGKWYVTEARHLFNEFGYETSFEAVRNALFSPKKRPAPPPPRRAAQGKPAGKEKLDIAIEDQTGAPLEGQDYVLVMPDGKTKRTGTSGAAGIQEDNLDPGTAKLELKAVSSPKWTIKKK
ncbi:MAG: phage late control D family protein [Planctomycetes bacterium]|nr:phage late control D family protein [Planctomycetota bacterium]